MFFDLMTFIPSSIITDQQITLITALSQLKKELKLNYVHLLDQFHLLKTIRKKLPNKSDIQYFRDVMFSKNLR